MREEERVVVTELLLCLANTLSGNAFLGPTEIWTNGLSRQTRKYRIAFQPRCGTPSSPADASRLSTAKRLAIAVLLDDPGSANALADYLQEIGVVPDGALTERKRCEDAIERMWAECRAEKLEPHPAFNVMVKLFQWIRCGDPVAGIES